MGYVYFLLGRSSLESSEGEAEGMLNLGVISVYSMESGNLKCPKRSLYEGKLSLPFDLSREDTHESRLFNFQVLLIGGLSI